MTDDSTPPGEHRVEDIDDPFDVPEEVDEAWEDEDGTSDQAPTG